MFTDKESVEFEKRKQQITKMFQKNISVKRILFKIDTWGKQMGSQERVNKDLYRSLSLLKGVSYVTVEEV